MAVEYKVCKERLQLERETGGEVQAGKVVR